MHSREISKSPRMASTAAVLGVILKYLSEPVGVAASIW